MNEQPYDIKENRCWVLQAPNFEDRRWVFIDAPYGINLEYWVGHELVSKSEPGLDDARAHWRKLRHEGWTTWAEDAQLKEALMRSEDLHRERATARRAGWNF